MFSDHKDNVGYRYLNKDFYVTKYLLSKQTNYRHEGFWPNNVRGWNSSTTYGPLQSQVTALCIVYATRAHLYVTQAMSTAQNRQTDGRHLYREPLYNNRGEWTIGGFYLINSTS